jgi:hypothetical protein
MKRKIFAAIGIMFAIMLLFAVAQEARAATSFNKTWTGCLNGKLYIIAISATTGYFEIDVYRSGTLLSKITDQWGCNNFFTCSNTVTVFNCISGYCFKTYQESKSLNVLDAYLKQQAQNNMLFVCSYTNCFALAQQTYALIQNSRLALLATVGTFGTLTYMYGPEIIDSIAIGIAAV